MHCTKPISFGWSGWGWGKEGREGERGGRAGGRRGKGVGGQGWWREREGGEEWTGVEGKDIEMENEMVWVGGDEMKHALLAGY